MPFGGREPGSTSSPRGGRPCLVRLGSGLALIPVSLPFQTCFPSSSRLVSGPSFLSDWGGGPQGLGQGGQRPERGWSGFGLQSLRRPLAPMWRSSSSPSSGECASATSARAARRAVSQARGARIPPRPIPPSRSAWLFVVGWGAQSGFAELWKASGLASGPVCSQRLGAGTGIPECLDVLCTLNRSMATLGRGRFASLWSPKTPLTGLTPMSLWGKTAGMASMRLSSAQTAASTGELLTSRVWG